MEEVNGSWEEGEKMTREASDKDGWLNVSALQEPYRLEGHKTLGYEIAQQLGWRLPDVIFCPAGEGMVATAIWKAFEELQELG